MRLVTLLCAMALGLVACGPPSPERVARICEERARDAAGPRGTVGVGVGSGGVSTGAAISVTGDYLARRDPQQVYDDCVARQGGGMTWGVGVGASS